MRRGGEVGIYIYVNDGRRIVLLKKKIKEKMGRGVLHKTTGTGPSSSSSKRKSPRSTDAPNSSPAQRHSYKKGRMTPFLMGLALPPDCEPSAE